MKARYIIGIDTGVNTGVAVWDCDRKKLIEVISLPIHRAINFIAVEFLKDKSIHVRVEDARKRKWFGKGGREKLQGAGSIKRDAKIWEDFLTDIGVSFELVAPKDNKTKLSAESFKSLTKWEGKTNEHSRDSAMLVWNY